MPGVNPAWLERGWLPARAAATPRATAWTYGAEARDYASLLDDARAAAQRFHDFGVRPGDRLAIHAANGPLWPAVVHALRMLEVTLVPLNLRLTAAELSPQLEDAAVRWLLAEREATRNDARGVVEELGGLHPALGRIEFGSNGFACTREAAPAPEAARSEPAPMALLFTSGTSGRPKAAVLDAAAFEASAHASAKMLGAGPDDRWLACMPLFHIGGLSILVRACLAGGCVVLQRGFDPAAASDALDTQGVTQLSLVANMLDRLLAARAGKPAPEGLRCVLVGGGPTPPALLARARASGFPVAPTYGLTEAASQVATCPADDPAAARGDALVVLPGTELRIIDREGRTVETGAVGEICVRGPTLMRGYLRGASDALAPRGGLREGWLHTGDMGALDAAGRLRVLDRRDDLIVSGGENVYPAEVEAVLVAHAAVLDAAVVARADARYGARPVAHVVVAADSVDDQALTLWCRERLAGFKVPVAFVRHAALPRSPSGKLLRRALREEGPG